MLRIAREYSLDHAVNREARNDVKRWFYGQEAFMTAADLRRSMVDDQIIARGVHGAALLDALRAVPRDVFVPPALGAFAYYDTPLPIEVGQTISQPYIVARMIEAAAIRAGDRVLEIGAGSGYAAAVMSRIAGQVYAVERHVELTERARARMASLNYDNVEIRTGDGTLGWPEVAPFDAITVAAAGPAVPPPLREQLAIGGRLVMPIGEAGRQRLIRIMRVSKDDFDEEKLDEVSFVPLIGAYGWAAEFPSTRGT